MKIENDNIWLSLDEICDVLKLNKNSFNVNSGRQGTYKSVIKRRCTDDKGWYIEVSLSSFPNNALTQLTNFYQAKIEILKEEYANFDNTIHHKKVAELVVNYFQKEDVKFFETDYDYPREKANRYAWRAAYLRLCTISRTEMSLHFQGLSKIQFLEIVQFVMHENKIFDTLKGNTAYLQKLMTAWVKKGLLSVVDGRNTNQNGLKADNAHQRVIKAIALGMHAPNAVDVQTIYTSFLDGDRTVVDAVTGEVFMQENFKDLSVSWVYRFLNSPEMRAAYALKHAGKVTYESRFRPHLHGERPNFSLSLVTCDDWEMPFFVGTKRPVTYIAFDVATGAILSFVRAKDNAKDGVLFEDCIRTMLMNPDLGGYLPAEIQTEQHICSLYKDTILKEGTIFQYVSMEEGERPMAKYAEGFIRQLKYELLKSEEFFRGRPHARLLANRFNKNKKYPSITEGELSILMENIVSEWNSREDRLERFKKTYHKELLEMNYAQVAKYLGRKIETTLRNGQYFYANNQKWHLPNADIIKKLENNHLEIRVLEGLENVFVFQNDKFICECGAVKTMQRAKIEQTEADKIALGEFMAFRKASEKNTKEILATAKTVAVEKRSLLTAKIIKPIATKEVINEGVELLDEEMEDNQYLRLYNNKFKNKND